jgi:hypothetical protein
MVTEETEIDANYVVAFQTAEVINVVNDKRSNKMGKALNFYIYV